MRPAGIVLNDVAVGVICAISVSLAPVFGKIGVATGGVRVFLPAGIVGSVGVLVTVGVAVDVNPGVSVCVGRNVGVIVNEGVSVGKRVHVGVIVLVCSSVGVAVTGAGAWVIGNSGGTGVGVNGRMSEQPPTKNSSSKTPASINRSSEASRYSRCLNRFIYLPFTVKPS